MRGCGRRHRAACVGDASIIEISLAQEGVPQHTHSHTHTHTHTHTRSHTHTYTHTHTHARTHTRVPPCALAHHASLPTCANARTRPRTLSLSRALSLHTQTHRHESFLAALEHVFFFSCRTRWQQLAHAPAIGQVGKPQGVGVASRVDACGGIYLFIVFLLFHLIDLRFWSMAASCEWPLAGQCHLTTSISMRCLNTTP
jgi:hypothetical protein